MKKRIYLLRHGQTEYNKLGIWQGSGVDSPLNEEGIRQATLFFNKYKEENFDLLIHSRLKRAKQTIQAFKNLGIPVLESELINEISWGIYEGKAHTEESLAMYKSVIGEWGKENYSKAFEGGESAIDLMERVDKFLLEVKNHNASKVLICSHGRTIRALICSMKNEPYKEMEKYRHNNTGLFIADLENNVFEFSEMNSTKHL